MRISIMGTGYVGLGTGACLAEFGHNVVCMDRDEQRIIRLQKGDIPIYEPGLVELIYKGMWQARLGFTADIVPRVEQALVIFIAVGTPARQDGSADLGSVEDAAFSIAHHVNSYKVVTKSTVPVGTGEQVRKIVEEEKKGRVPSDIVSNPEFLQEGRATDDFLKPDRIVIGTESATAVAIMLNLYRPLKVSDIPFVITDIRTAELIKYASNTFLATKISFINEL